MSEDYEKGGPQLLEEERDVLQRLEKLEEALIATGENPTVQKEITECRAKLENAVRNNDFE